eukprot:2122661-Rhodomonas_salina.1
MAPGDVEIMLVRALSNLQKVCPRRCTAEPCGAHLDVRRGAATGVGGADLPNAEQHIQGLCAQGAPRAHAQRCVVVLMLVARVLRVSVFLLRAGAVSGTEETFR